MKVSIAALIYKSTIYADFVYQQVHKYTPMIQSGDADFFFVANDASDEVIEHLDKMKYPYIKHTNHKYTDEELFARGIGWPEYIHRVYRAWNRCILEAKHEYVCLINSDNGFSHDWLENLIKYANPSTAVSSLLIERGHETLGTFPSSLNGTGSIGYHCGKTPLEYDECRFIEYATRHKEVYCDKTTSGGVYMPILFNKQKAIDVGLYPEGNTAGSTFFDVIDYGDRVFMRKLKEIGVEHITSWDSVSYHFQQGEMEY